MQYISILLIFISVVASFYFGIKAQLSPNSLEVYTQAGISGLGIKLGEYI